MDPEARDGRFLCLTFADSGLRDGCRDTGSHLRAFLYEPRPWAKAPDWGWPPSIGIVRQHGGWLKWKVSRREGTTFKIFFPPSEGTGGKLGGG